MQGYKRSCNYKALNRATMIGLFITILLFIGYANNHSFTNDFVKDKQDSINTMAYDLEVAHKSLTMPSEPNKVLIEMERTRRAYHRHAGNQIISETIYTTNKN
jgi:hypothetical protein